MKNIYQLNQFIKTMKRKLTFAALFLCSLMTFAQFSGSGSGTESDPYLILNPVQLSQMRNYLNTSGVYFKMMADIDVEEYIEDEWGSQGWQPIGTSSNKFKGILDGSGHSITGLWSKRSDYVGLFAYTDGATIKNLRLDVNMQGNDYVGGFVGSSSSTTISGCRLSGSINGNQYVGGYVGKNAGGTFSNSQSTAIVSGSGDNVGGLIGHAGSLTINYCSVHGSVTSPANQVGGLVGYADQCTFGNDCFFGSVQGKDCVGGLVGKDNYARNLNNSFAIADVIATGDDVGGLVGYYYNYFHSGGDLNNNYFNGSTSGHKNVGGLIGWYKGGGQVCNNCYSNAVVIGEENVGGILGLMSSGDRWNHTLKSCMAINTTVHATVKNAGRVYGKKESGTIGTMGTTDENKGWNRTLVMVSGVAQETPDGEQHGTNASETTLKLKATYVGANWTFDADNWAIQETECYPYMGWQTAPPVITSDLVANATTISGKCIDGGTVTLEIDGKKKQVVSSGQRWTFDVDPLQAGHEVRISAQAEGKVPSYFTTQVVSYAGKGTEADPYRVYTAEDLTGVYRKGYYKLMNDIDLTDWINKNNPTEGWTGVGREGSTMNQFDGNGFKITGLWSNSTRNHVGLFSMFSNGTIKNLTVMTATGKQVKGGDYTGVLIGRNTNGKIIDCTVDGDVEGTIHVGGFVGASEKNELTNLLYRGTITSSTDNTHIGGIVGASENDQIKGVYTDATINASGESVSVGGVAGTANSNISESVTKGTLTATGGKAQVGGIVGTSNANGVVENCIGSASLNSSYAAAGIVSYNYGTVTRSLASGDLSTKNYAAGVVGYNDGTNAIVSKSVAINNKIDVVYESQQTSQSGGYGQRIAGGLKNGAPTPEMSNYALNTMQVSLNDVPQKVYDDIMNGTAKTVEQLNTESTYTGLGWDFSNIWYMKEATGYPDLKVAAVGSVTVTATDCTREYGEANPAFGYESVGKTLEGTPDLSCEATKASPIGTYPIVAKRGSVKNYKDTYVNGTLTITKAPLTITAKDYTIQKGDDMPTFDVTYSGFKNNDTKSVLTQQPKFVCDVTSSNEIGTYKITVSGAEANNYNISFAKGTLTITDADPVTVTAKSYTRKYGEANPTFGYTSEGKDLKGTPDISCEATKTSPAGTYPIVIKKGSVKNYNDSYVNGTLTVTKAPLTITVNNYTIQRGDEMPTLAVAYSGFKNDEKEDVLTKKPTVTCSATSESEIGTYDIVVSGAEADNYDITYVKGTLSIVDADPVTVTAKSYSRKYGEANPAFEYTSKGKDLKGVPDLSCEATVTSPVGTYPIEVKKGSVTNYNDSYVNGTLTITKASLTITAQNYTIKQGEALPTFEYTYSDFQNNETEEVLTKKPVVTCVATSGSAVGTYNITISGAEAENYDFTYVKGMLTITEADPVTVTAKSYTREYGEANPTFEYTSEGKALEGTPELSCVATANSPVGTYSIVANKGSVTNYNDSYVNGTLTITKAPLTITAKNYTIKQGEELPTFEIEYSGFKNNETEDALTKKPVIACVATSWSDAGKYDITIDGAEAENYDISYVKGTLTITEADPFTLTYMVDGEVYRAYQVKYGDAITAEEEPTKEGYTFSGWSEIPVTMPNKDVTVTGTFIINTPEVSAGDANGDGTVNVFDVTAMVNYILGSPTDGFVFEAADVNGDGIVNVFDVTKVVNIILGVDDSEAKTRKAEGLSGTDKLYFEDFEIEPGEEKEVTILLDNPGAEYRDLQFDLYLPEGITVVQDEDEEFLVDTGSRCTKKHTIGFSYTDGHYVCMLYSTAKNPLTGNSGDILTITLKADDNVAPGAKTGSFRNVSLSKTDATGPTYDEFSFGFTVKGADGIEDVIADDGEFQIYTLDGKLVETLQQGVNILRYSNGTTKSVYVK